MKLYVIPVEKDCNATCKFCITNFRNFKKAYLDLGCLEILKKLRVDKIEITGGGEPLLHEDINKIIEICCEKSKTQLYTNGMLIGKLSNPEELNCLCVSRAHYLDEENRKIMGIDYDFENILKLNVPIKLSLLVHKSGINNVMELENYFNWALKNGIKKVVVRQLFEDFMNEEFVSSEDLMRGLFRDCKLIKRDSLFYFEGMEVEFEGRHCACELNNPVLHANGELIKGWTDIKGYEGEEYDIDRN